MSDLDALLERSRKPGAFAERKRFTLSRNKAVEKMRQFSLRHPTQYLLELISGAVFAGARWIFVDIAGGQMTVGWIGGRTLKPGEVDGIFDYLFSDQLDPKRRHLHQIAVAVNALLQQKPRLIRLESGGMSGAVRLDLNSAGIGEVGVPKDAMQGTYVHVTLGTSGWLGRFVGTAPSATELVELGCMYCPVPIFLNGSGPLGWDRGTPLTNFGRGEHAAFAADGRDGWVTDVGPHGGEFEIVVGGVRVVTRNLPEIGRGFSGVIRDDGLRKTADMSDIVEDERFRTMLATVQPHATRLRRRLRPTYRPPALPPVKAPTSAKQKTKKKRRKRAKARTIPIDRGVRFLGRGERCTVDDLQELPSDAPLFWMPPDELAGVDVTPYFPYRVLLLGPRQIVEFARRFDHLKPKRIEMKDLKFVRDQLAKSVRFHKVRVVTSYGKVEFRLYEAGPMPAFRTGTAVEVPVFHDGELWFRMQVPVVAPRVSAACYSDRGPDGGNREELATEIAATVARNLWRLIPKGGALDPPKRALLVALLGAQLRPFFVAVDDTIELQGLLSPGTPEERARLLSAPLTKGGITARDLLALPGTDRVLDCDADDLAVLAPLEEWLGAGHLRCEAMGVAPVCEVYSNGVYWRVGPAHDGDPVRAFLALGMTFQPAPRDGFQAIDGPIEILYGGVRPGFEADLEPGWDLLVKTLAGQERLGLQEAFASHESRRRADLRSLALLALRLRRPDGLPVLQATHGTWLSGSSVRRALLMARGGPEVLEAGTVAVSGDELRLLAESGKPRLRFDDPPEVWSQRPGPDDPDWLVTVEVDSAEAVGWLGLRYPFDPTGSVLMRRGGSIWAVSSLDRHLQCHGMVRARGDRVERGVGTLHREAAKLVGNLVKLFRHRDRARREAAHSYGRQIAWLAHHSGAAVLPMKLATRVAERLPVTDADGAEWGTFRLWLVTDPSLRPAISGLPEVQRRKAPPAVGALEGRIALAVSRVDPALGVRVRHSEDIQAMVVVSLLPPLLVVLNARHPVISAANAGDRDAVGLLLIAVVRRLYEIRRRSDSLDFLQMQAAALRSF